MSCISSIVVGLTCIDVRLLLCSDYCTPGLLPYLESHMQNIRCLATDKFARQTFVCVRICLYIIQVMFTVYLCSVVVRSNWNYVAIGISRLQLRCTERSTAATGFTMNIGYIVAYARAYAPLQSCIWELLGSRLA